MAKRAHRLLLLTVFFYLLAVAVASPIDIYYHTQVRFESFWAYPHLFLYASVLLGAATVGGIAANPQLRACFGAPLTGLPKPLQLPAPLLILGVGFTMLAAAGGVDWFWHTTWGQNETRWSFPHGTLAFGVFVVALGAVAARVALKPLRPFGPYTALTYGLLAIGFSMSSLLGPMAFNISPDVNGAVAQMPGFWGPDTREVMQIIGRWHLERTNLFFPAMAAAWAVTAISVVRVLDPRPRAVLLTTGVAMAILAAAGLSWAWRTSLLGTPSAWMPLMIMPAAAAWLAVEGDVLYRPLGPALAGLTIGMLTALIYNPTGLGLGLAVLSAPAGAAAGILAGKLAAQLKAPTTKGTVTALAVLALGAPALLGALDLYFRFNVP